jgi:hypothetical protein
MEVESVYMAGYHGNINEAVKNRLTHERLKVLLY